MSSQQEDVSAAISFLKLVELNSCIWNYTLKIYSRTDITSVTWKKIAEEVKDTEQNCRDRWENVRTSFGRSMKPPKSGSGGRSKKPYYLASHLDFFLPLMKGASASGNVPTEENYQETYDDTQVGDIQVEATTLQVIPEVTQLNDTHPESETNILQDPTYRKRKEITPAKSNADKAFVEWIEIKKKKEAKTNQEELQDVDLLFFRSLLPYFKKLNDKRKRLLKLKIATLLNEAEAETETSSSSYSWGSSSLQSTIKAPPSPSILHQDDTNFFTFCHNIFYC